MRNRAIREEAARAHRLLDGLRPSHVARSTLPGGLIARQIPKRVDVPNDRCVGLIPPPRYRFVPDACTEGTRRPCHPAVVTAATKSQHGGRWLSTSRICFQGCRRNWSSTPTACRTDGSANPISLGRARHRLSVNQGEVGPAGTRRWLSRGYRRDRALPAQARSTGRLRGPHRRPTTDPRPIAVLACARSDP